MAWHGIDDIHNHDLESLPLCGKVVIAPNAIMVKNTENIVHINDASESAGLLELKLVDQDVP